MKKKKKNFFSLNTLSNHGNIFLRDLKIIQKSYSYNESTDFNGMSTHLEFFYA